MRQVLTSYTFNVAAKTLTLTGFTTVDLKRLFVVMNDTVGAPVYTFGDASLSTATVAGNVVTFSVVPAGSANTDQLTVIYDWKPGDTAVPPQLPVAGVADAAGNVAAVKGASTAPLASDSALVVALSPNSTLTTGPTDAVTSAALSMAATTNAVTTAALNGAGTVAVTLTSGAWTGTVTFEGSQDNGATWTTVQGVNSSTGASTSTATTGGMWKVSANGLSQFRVRCSTTGAASTTVTLRASTAPGSSSGNQGSPNTVANAWPVLNTDGTNTAAVKPAATAAATGDPALVVAISPNSPLTVGAPVDVVTTGNVSMASVANNVVTGTLNGAGTVGIDISGAWTGTLTFEGSVDGTTWQAVSAGVVGSASSSSTTVTSNGEFFIPVQGLRLARVRAGVVGTGTAAITLRVSVVPSNLPGSASAAAQGAAAALAGGWPVKVTDGTNIQPTGDVAARAMFTKTTDGVSTAAVKPATTAPVAADPALVTAISPNGNAVRVTDGTNFMPTGDVAARAGFERITDGANTAAVKAASTAPAATDPALVVAVSPNGVVNENVAQVNGQTVNVGAGISGSGTQRVAVASDSSIRVTDGTNTAAVKGAATTPVVADPAVVVSVSPNSATLSENLAQVAGNAVNVGTGASASGTQRVAVANDSKVQTWDGTNTVTVKPAATAASAADTSLIVGVSPNSNAVKVTDGTNTAAVKAASTAAAAIDPAVVVSVSPNSIAKTDLEQVAGQVVDVGIGAAGTGTQRVSVSNDSQVKLWDGGTQAVVKPAAAPPLVGDAALVTSLSPNGNVVRQGVGSLLPADAWMAKVTDGTTTAAVAPASTAALLTDPALVVAVSPNTPVSVNTVDVASSSVINFTIANNAAETATLNNAGTVALEIGSGWTGTGTFEGTVDGTTWTPVSAVRYGTTTTSTTTTTGGEFYVPAQGLAKVRFRVSAVGTGATTVAFRVSQSPSTSPAAAGGGGGQTTIWDGTANTAAVKPASTAALGTDPALVVAISPNSPLTVAANTDQVTTGTLPTAVPGAVTTGVLNGIGVVSINLTGVWSNNFNAQVSIDGTTWATVPAINVSTGASSTNISVNGEYTVSAAGMQLVRLFNSATFPPRSGTASVTLRASAAAFSSTTSGGTTVVQGADGGVANAWYTRISDGISTAAVKAASTAPLATDPALVVTESPNSAPKADQTYTGVLDPTVVNNDYTSPTLNSSGTLAVRLSMGGFTNATVVFEGSVDTVGSEWYTLSALPLGGGVAVTSVVLSGAPVAYLINAAGMAMVRVRTSVADAVGTNAVDVTMRSSSVPAPTASASTSNQGTPNTVPNAWPMLVTDGTRTATVKAAAAPALSGDSALVVAVSPNSTLQINGNVTSAQGAPTILPNAWPIKNTDGTNTAAVKAATTAAVAADPALVVALSPNSPLPTAGAPTNGSGTITTANTAQTVFAASTTRRYLMVTNPLGATAVLWVNPFGAAAVAASPSIGLNAGDSLVFDATFVPNTAVSIISSTAGAAFTAYSA